MKKNISLMLLIGATALIFSCRKQNVIEDFDKKISVKDSKIPDSLQYLVNFLVSRGEKANNITYSGSDSSFVIDNDVFMFKKDVKLAMEVELGKNSINQNNLTIEQLVALRKTAVRPDVIGQRQSLNGSGGNPWFVNDQFIINIKVKINATTPSWRNAAQLAIYNFNLNSLTSITKVKIREVLDGQNVTISETGTTYSNPDVIADAQRPHYALMPPGQYVVAPGSYIRIYNNHDYFTLAQKTLTITHELGHVIGLAHTNGTDSDEAQIAGTAASDSFSYMNSSLILDSFEGFTNNDLIALRTMYPKTIGAWELLSGKATNISIGHNNDTYSVGNNITSTGDYNMQWWDGGSWTQLTAGNWYGNGSAIKIAVPANDRYPFWIDNSKQIYSMGYPNPIAYPGAEATDIATNGDGELYIVSTESSSNGYNIKKWNPAIAAWENISSPGAVKIASGLNGGMALIDNTGNFYIKRENTSFFYGSSQYINLKEVALNGVTGLQGHVFALGGTANANGDYQLFRWTGYDWYDVGATGYTVAVDNQGHPWLTKKNGDIYRNLSL